jgi:hypothetical protein
MCKKKQKKQHGRITALRGDTKGIDLPPFLQSSVSYLNKIDISTCQKKKKKIK